MTFIMTTFPLPNITCEKVSNLSLRIYKANLATLNRFAITLLSEELSKGFNQRLGNCIETVLQSGMFGSQATAAFDANR
jgi:hypothetical protein